jgi:hypothetical protein
MFKFPLILYYTAHFVHKQVSFFQFTQTSHGRVSITPYPIHSWTNGDSPTTPLSGDASPVLHEGLLLIIPRVKRKATIAERGQDRAPELSAFILIWTTTAMCRHFCLARGISGCCVTSGSHYIHHILLTSRGGQMKRHAGALQVVVLAACLGNTTSG